MMVWQAIAEERRMLYSPIGLRLVDDFTGRAPIGAVQAHLDLRRADMTWQPTEIAAVRTPSEVITYPGLGRSAHFALQPTFRYRVRLEAGFYRPDYLLNQDAIEFDVHPYDDDNPPAVLANLPQDVFLMPAVNYPYPGHVRVLRGQVLDNAGDPAANVEVTERRCSRTSAAASRFRCAGRRSTRRCRSMHWITAPASAARSTSTCRRTSPSATSSSSTSENPQPTVEEPAMPEYLSPGVYIEEIANGPRPIQGVGTSTAGFVGRTERGPTRPRLVTSWADYTRWFGDTIDQAVSLMPYGVRGFFENGGQRAFVARVASLNGAAPAGVNLATQDPGGVVIANNVLRIRANGAGIWGNNIVVWVRAASRADLNALPPRDWFRLTVLYYRDGLPVPFVDPTNSANFSNPLRREPQVMEDFDNLTFVDGRSNHVLSVVNGSSKLIEVDYLDTGTNLPGVSARPQQCRWRCGRRLRRSRDCDCRHVLARAGDRTGRLGQ